MPTFGVDVLGTEPFAGYPSSYVSPTNFPTLLLEEAFTTDPLSGAPLWTQHDQDDVRSFTVTQCGRSSELDAPSAGSAGFVVDVSENRWLDPTNPDSPYAPNVIPNRRERFRVAYEGVTWPLHEGFVNAHNVRHEKPAFIYCDVPCTDGFKILARGKLTYFGNRPIERSDQRVTAILDEIGWPANRRRISRGSARLFATGDSGDDGEYREMSPLDALLACDRTEGGRMFIDPEGVLVFLSRSDMQSAERQTFSQATFGDDVESAEIPYDSFTLENSDVLIRNKIEVTNPHFPDAKVVAVDAASVAAHGELAYSVEVWDASVAGMRSTASWLLKSHKDPTTRVLSLTVTTSNPTDVWPTGLYAPMLSLRIADRVTFIRRPAVGDPFEQDCFIESRTDTADQVSKTWTTTLGLSFAPAPLVRGKWGTGKWGTAKWSY